METKKLSELYNLACLNAHQLIDELYEEVHTPEGDPKVAPEEIKKIRSKFLAKVRHELELIQASVEEHNEE